MLEKNTRPCLLILYRRFPGYMLSCVKEFASTFQFQVHIVKYPSDPLAPFSISDTEGITYYQRDKLNKNQLIELAKKVNPQAILVSGWGDSGYISLSRHFLKKGIPVICMMDNQWKNTLKQKIASLLARNWLRRRFSHLWVSGMYQYEFGRRLGFQREKIFTDMYSADVPRFLHSSNSEEMEFSKRFIFVGRMLPIKGIDTFVKAIELLESSSGIGDWKFYFIGNGPDVKLLPSSEHIEHISFMQPEELGRFAGSGGVFVLPSRYDPWGVVVHEFAAAGFPLIVSEKVGARTAFVKQGYNGFIFQEDNPEQLAICLKRIIESSDKDLFQMGKRSKLFAQCITPELWARTLKEIVSQKDPLQLS